ncbi:hypothetical protein NC651_027910 [Populus alba x Populus x berolinensis]|nr:hypothetical protein NC651_027910 [Populus alba x Populus x berolinensis]
MFLQEPVLYVASAALSGVEVDIAIRDVGGLLQGIGIGGVWFKFLCDNGDGSHEIKIAMRDLGGLVVAAVFSLAYKLQIDCILGQRRTTDLEFCINAI